jgi:hypothetical protein
MPQELRSDILAFYQDLDAPISTKTNGDDWARVLKELDQLRAANADLAGNGSNDTAGGKLSNPEVSAGVGVPSRP